MYFISYSQMAKDVMKLVPFCIEKKISAIYGVPRSGLVPAVMLANELHLPCGIPGDDLLHGGNRIEYNRDKAKGPVLLLEDSVNNGNGIKEAFDEMFKDMIIPITACVYTKPKSVDKVDFVCKVIEGPRIYQWNIFNCDLASKIMFDLDGVFCLDPPIYECDDCFALKDTYLDYIKNAIPLHIPSWPIGWIVTNRLLKYYSFTKKWLNKYNIKVLNKIYMQDFPSAEDRRKL